MDLHALRSSIKYILEISALSSTTFIWLIYKYVFARRYAKFTPIGLFDCVRFALLCFLACVFAPSLLLPTLVYVCLSVSFGSSPPQPTSMEMRTRGNPHTENYINNMHNVNDNECAQWSTSHDCTNYLSHYYCAFSRTLKRNYHYYCLIVNLSLSLSLSLYVFWFDCVQSTCSNACLPVCVILVLCVSMLPLLMRPLLLLLLLRLRLLCNNRGLKYQLNKIWKLTTTKEIFLTNYSRFEP